MRTTLVLTFLFGVACSTLVPFKRLSAAENEELQKSCGHMKTPLDEPDSSRVLDGDVVIPGYADWVVKIEKNSRHHCTGALISPRHVLTASHCKLHNTGIYSVWAGRGCAKQSCAHELEQFAIRAVVGVPQNDDLDSDGWYVGPDIVIVELDRDVTNSTGSPACLWNPKQDLPEEATLLAAGWGNDAREPYNEDDFTWSQQKFKNYSGRMIFTKAAQGHQATGSGDSGSGLILVHEKRVYNLGPLNGGPADIYIEEGSADPDSHYTRAADFVNFICHFTGICVEGATSEGDYIEGRDYVVCESADRCETKAESGNGIYDEDDYEYGEPTADLYERN